jgi:hypothetical protein
VDAWQPFSSTGSINLSDTSDWSKLLAETVAYVSAGPMSEPRKPDYYRQEAEEIRSAAEIVRDLQFREQLLGIAKEYEAWAARLEAQEHPEAA